MNDKLDYLEINKAAWNSRTGVHYDSEFYDNESFIKGRSSLNSIELDIMPDLNGKKVLHLQCHFGQDTISLNRLGAEVTGIDLSDVAIKKAKELSELTQSTAKFICSDVYDLSNHLNDQFDVVFTTYGTIGWLPDINKWAEVVSHFLKPGGQLVFAEFHPVIWMFDDDFSKVNYRYFNSDPIQENEDGTYTDKSAPINQDYVSWNHGMAEVISALISKGLVINSLKEFDYSPYNCFSHTVEFEPNKFRIKHLNNYIPMVYSILASK